MKTTHQIGEEVYIKRSQILEAPYNPRIIGEGQEKRLRTAIQKHGLIGTLFWNKRTGNLVAGHQRLKALDYLEKYPKKTTDYELRVTAVDIPVEEEKKLNVILNNPSVQGEFDIEKLGALLDESGMNFEDFGITKTDMAFYFDGDPRFAELFADTEEVIHAKKKIKAVKDARNAGTEKMKAEQSANFFSMLVFQDEKTKQAFMRKCGIPACEEYINGAALAKKFNIDLGIEK